MNAEFDKAILPVDGREGLVLFFTVGDQTFGIRLTEVSHIMPFAAENVKDGAQKGMMLQAVAMAGETVPTIDLTRFLGIPVAGKIEERVLILFREGKERFGLLADEVQAIVGANDAPEMAWPRLLGEEGARVHGGFFSRNDNLILALNPEYIWTLMAPAKGR